MLCHEVDYQILGSDLQIIETEVYYDPEAPDVCVIQTGATWSTYLPFGIGGLFFVIGALLVGSLAFKLVAGTLLIGAAATSALGKSAAPAQPRNMAKHEFPPSPDDDGIEIT